MTTRRDFLARLGIPALAVAMPRSPRARPAASTFVDLAREPDAVLVQTESGDRSLARGAAGHWSAPDVNVGLAAHESGARVSISSSPSASGLLRLHVRWRVRVADTARVLGDAWERAYGDLEWRGLVPDRVMPWYFATTDAGLTHCYGVRTGPAAFCWWQLDADGASLWADLRSGGVGVRLGDRALDVCDIVSRAGRAGESAHAALHAFCRAMCAAPRTPSAPVFGSNDWYWAYGKNSAESVLRDAGFMAELAPAGPNRPFVVIDDGWQPGRGNDKTGIGDWDRGNEKFPDLPGLVARVRGAGARAGIWLRPLQAAADTPDGWRLSRARSVLDPTVPEVRQKITADVERIRGWGFELLKHDYTTFDLLGRWGFQMGDTLTRDGWTFAAGRDRTSAEIIADLYAAIRAAAGDALVIGCNTVSHLSAGVFDLCRVGDDTSGTEWARTRKMGVNSLAFRGVQHGAFYAADADCAAVTSAVPWALEREWLDLVARSGTPLFVSIAPDALGPAQRMDLRAALAIAARPRPLGEPLDWTRAIYPRQWRLMGRVREYDWVAPDGTAPG